MELGRVVPVIGLTVLLVADAVLIGWALRPVPTDDFVPSTSSASASATPATPAGSPKPSATPVDLKAVPVQQFVTATSPRVAWVVRAGSCTDSGSMWVTKDVGDTWKRSDLPGRLLRLRPDSATAAFGAGGDVECTLKLWSTGDAGATWTAGASPDKTWSRDPGDAKAVHTATDLTARPCGAKDVIDLAVLDADRATVLCQNGVVRSTTDGGERWDETFTRARSLALTVAEGGTGVLVTADPQCPGVVAVPIAGNEPAAEGVCVPAPAKNGTVSASTAAGGWWLTAGSDVFTADDPEGPWNKTRKGIVG